MQIVYYTSKTGNTQRFANKLDFTSTQIINDLIISKPFILFCPTYADRFGKHSVPPKVVHFLNEKINRDNLIGVVGFGNRNFGRMFAIGADVVANKCNVPILHKVELFGTQADVEIVTERIINEFRK